MLPQFESAARGALASRGASNIRVEGKSVKDVIRELFAEVWAEQKKVRLTWNPASIGEPADPGMKIGLLCKWKPYTGPLGIGRYFVQNMMVLYSNGEPVTDMTTISTEKRTERIVDGKGNFLRDQVFPSDREQVDNALRYYMQIAVRLDPNLCRYCVQFSTDDRDEYLRHMKKVHSAEFQQMLKGDDDEEPEATTAQAAEPAEPVSRKARAAQAQ